MSLFVKSLVNKWANGNNIKNYFLGNTKKRALLGMAMINAVALTAGSSKAEKKDQAMDQADQKLLTSYVWHLDRVSQPKATQESAAATAAEQSEALPSPPAEMRPFDISFDQERVSVQGLCNQLGGSYQVDGDEITISQMMSTRKLCSDEHTSELQSRGHLVCRLLLEKKKKNRYGHAHASIT